MVRYLFSNCCFSRLLACSMVCRPDEFIKQNYHIPMRSHKYQTPLKQCLNSTIMFESAQTVYEAVQFGSYYQFIRNYNQTSFEMGESQSSELQAEYPSTLMLIESAQDRNFGAVDILRTKQPPYEYVMDFKKNFVEDNERMGKYMRFVNQIRNMDHKNIAKIHHCQLIEENQVCIKHKKIHTFCNYYNFTLEEAIEKKKLQDSYFPESELVYIMSSLLDVGSYLQKYGISVGEYRSKTIYLSPEGYIKIYLLEVEDQNRHHCFFKALCERSQIENYILSPEQLRFITDNNYQARYDVFKSDVFAIAMVVLELITLDKPKFYYSEDKTELKIDRIAFDISSMGKIYSQPFINLLKCCLHPSPASRCSFQEAINELNFIRKSMKAITYCIRLQEDEEKSKKGSSKREIAISAKGQHILNGLKKRLTPSPISTLSSTASSSYKVESKFNSSRSSQAVTLKL